MKTIKKSSNAKEMKNSVSDIYFRRKLEAMDEWDLKELASHCLVSLLKIDILMDQREEYPNYMYNLFEEDWDEEDTDQVYDRIRTAFETMPEDELNSYFEHFAYVFKVVDELVQIDGENRIWILENL